MSPDFVMLQNFKHQITCITMWENVFLPLQQDLYSKSRHASPQNSSQIYTYVSWGTRGGLRGWVQQLLDDYKVL